jgi:signal transduction histidine kinase
MAQTGVGEIGALERAFNTMGDPLETSRDELRLLAEEQAALRRVATLVARRVTPAELFDAVVAEVHRLLEANHMRLLRYEPDGTATAVAGRAAPGVDIVNGERLTLEGRNVTSMVLRTGRPARIDTYDGAPGSIAAQLREQGIRCSVGAPILVEGRLWGVMIAAWNDDRALSSETEDRMAQFTELVATAIANAQSRAELAASRARVVATADETRRRIERDLHDGAQQRLVHTVITLKLARRALGDEGGPAVELVEEALDHAERANRRAARPRARDPAGGAESRPERRHRHARLPRAAPGVRRRHRRAAAPGVGGDRVLRRRGGADEHGQAHASSARVTALVEDGVLHVEVRDDGVGGACTDGISGLLGLHDRVAAMNGDLRMDSPPGEGTVVAVRLPVPDTHR